MKEAQHFFGTLRTVATALFLFSRSLEHYGVSAVGCGVCIFGSCTWSCDQSNCNNHATTINCGSLFSQCSPCTCDPAWYGSACQTASTPCASYCNGRAISAPGFFETQGCTCTCAPAYYGTTCASVATLCNIPTNCDARGTSFVSGYIETNGCTCECKPGWYNKRCSCPISQCSTAPGATAGSFLTFPLCYCACSLGYSGATCSRRDTISKDSISLSVTKMLSFSFSPSAEKGTRSASLSVSIALTKSGSPSAQIASRSLTFTDVASSSASLSVSMLTMTHNHSESLSISVASASHENSISHSPSFSVRPTVTTSSSMSISVSRSATFTVSASTSTMFSTTESQSREASASATTTTTISDSSTKSISRSRPSHTRSMSASLSETSSASHSSTTSFSESSSSSTTESDTFTPPLPITLTASCPTTARLMVSTQLTDLWLMRNQSSVNLSTRCALKTSAEAILSNSSELPCIPVFANVEGGRIALPSTRGPAPPFLVAVPYELDGNWIVRLPSFPTSAETTRENASTFLIRDNVSMITVQLDNHTNLTTASGTVFVLIPSVPEWQSKVIVMLETACGKHVVDYGTTPNDDGLYITVTWPQKQFSTLDQVAVGLVAAGSTLSGNPTAAAALAMVGLLSCSGSTPALQSAGYFVSVFFSLGPAAVGMGNLGIIFTISSLHFLVVKAWMHFHRERNLDELMSDMRFPAWSIFIAMYLLPGAVYGGVTSVASGENMVIGVVALLITATLVVGSQAYLFKVVLPLCDFRPYPTPHKTAFAFERLLLLPTFRWVPEASERKFMPLMGTRTKTWCSLSIADLLLTLCLSAATGLGVGTHGASCSVMPLIVAAIYLINAVIVIVLQPHRRPMDRVAFPVIWSLFGVMCILKYLTASEALIDTLQSVLSFVQLWQTVCALLVFFRERQWRQQILEDKSLPIEDVYPTVGKASATLNDADLFDKNDFFSDDGDDDDDDDDRQELDGTNGAGLGGEADEDGLQDFWFDIGRFAIDADDSGDCLDDIFGDHSAAAPLEPIFLENDVHNRFRLLQETELVVSGTQQPQLHISNGANYIGIAEAFETQQESLIISAPVFTQRNHVK